MNRVLKKSANRTREDGSALVEGTVSIGVLLAFLFTSIQLIFMGYTSLCLQFVAIEGIRLASIGEPEGASPSYDHASAIKNYVIDRSAALGIPLTTDQIEICPTSNVKCGGNSFVGVPNGLLSLRLTRDVTVFGVGNFMIDGIAIGRNEPREN